MMCPFHPGCRAFLFSLVRNLAVLNASTYIASFQKSSSQSGEIGEVQLHYFRSVLVLVQLLHAFVNFDERVVLIVKVDDLVLFVGNRVLLDKEYQAGEFAVGWHLEPSVLGMRSSRANKVPKSENRETEMSEEQGKPIKFTCLPEV